MAVDTMPTGPLTILSEEDAKRLDEIERAQWVLVRNDGAERWRCDPRKGGCGGKHEFFTVRCVPCPLQGLKHGLVAYMKNSAAQLSDLTPAHRARLERLARRVEKRPIPQLATSHPETARALGTPEMDTDYLGWVLGSVEPITAERARFYAGLINTRAHRVVIRVQGR